MRVTRRGLPRFALVAALAGLLAVVVPASAAGAAPAKRPAPPTGEVVPSALPIAVEVPGVINVQITVPLTVPGLLGSTPTTTPTPRPRPSTDPAPTSHPTTKPQPQTRLAATKIRHPKRVEAVSRQPTGAQTSAPAGHTSRPQHAQPTPTPTPKTTHGRHGARVPVLTSLLARSGLPGPLATVLVLLCLACALGVALIVQLSGRRGRHTA